MKVYKFLFILVILINPFYSIFGMNVSGSTGSVPTVVNQEATMFNVTVPTSLPISVDSKGIVTKASNVKIINNSFGPVVISDIRLDSNIEWYIDDYNKKFISEKVGEKKFGISINNCNSSNGSINITSLVNDYILKNETYDIIYDVSINTQKSSIINETIANLVIIVDWWKKDNYDNNLSDVSGVPGVEFEENKYIYDTNVSVSLIKISAVPKDSNSVIDIKLNNNYCNNYTGGQKTFMLNTGSNLLEIKVYHSDDINNFKTYSFNINKT